MSYKTPKNINWGKIYDELDNYFSEYLSLDNLLALGFEHNKSSGSLRSSSGSPLTYNGDFYLFHEVGRSSNLPVLFRIDGPGNNVGYSPTKYMTEFEKWDVKDLMVKGLSEHTKEHELGWKLPKVAKIKKTDGNFYKALSDVESYKGFVEVSSLRDYLQNNFEKGDYYERIFKKMGNHLHPLVFNELKTAYPRNVLNKEKKVMEFFDKNGASKFTYSFVIKDKGMCVLDHGSKSFMDSISFFNQHSSISSLNDNSRYDYLMTSALGKEVFEKHFKNEAHEKLMEKRKQEVEEKKAIDKKAEIAKRKLDIKNSQRCWSRCEINSEGGILQERGIPLDILKDERLNGTFAYGKETIGYGDAAKEIEFVGFKHPLKNGSVYSYERFCRKDENGKNVKLMRPGGKLFWMTNNLYNSDVVVITEKPLDAISHMALFKNNRYAYISSAGRPSPQMLTYAVKLIADVNTKREYPVMLVTAFDNDVSKKVNFGVEMSNLYMEAFKDSYTDVRVAKVEDGKGAMFSILPALEQNDWNDVLVKVNEINANKVEESHTLQQPASPGLSVDSGHVDNNVINNIDVREEMENAVAADKVVLIDESIRQESDSVIAPSSTVNNNPSI
jgi:hypothetical protein